MEKCEVNANEIKRLKERIQSLEKYREKDKTEVHELDKSLNIFITEMKNISEELKSIVSNFKEAIERSTNAQEKEIQALKEKIIETEHKMEKLDAKVEQETIIANAEKWKSISKYVLTTIIGILIGFIFMKLGLK